MGRNKKEVEPLEVKEQMTWREFFTSGLKRGVSTPPVKEMLITHIDEITGTPTYQGQKILHAVSDGRGDDKQQYYVEVLYDSEYVQSYLYDLLQGLGFISNNTINKILWENWFNPETGKLNEYGSTEGIRRQEEEDRIRAKTMAQMIEGTTVEEWMETIKQKRLDAIAKLTSSTDGNGKATEETASKGKKAAAAKS